MTKRGDSYICEKCGAFAHSLDRDVAPLCPYTINPDVHAAILRNAAMVLQWNQHGASLILVA